MEKESQRESRIISVLLQNVKLFVDRRISKPIQIKTRLVESKGMLCDVRRYLLRCISSVTAPLACQSSRSSFVHKRFPQTTPLFAQSFCRSLHSSKIRAILTREKSTRLAVSEITGSSPFGFHNHARSQSIVFSLINRRIQRLLVVLTGGKFFQQ
ncbi:hypothetical protein AVEN_171527-1 [Araneus ventricosus]|uniref:Uncharacterized protein n=1 Tax=Araneus ventricosus TaxID=182803 RepID=A0A4Y2WLU3_ARAVE|nr:hypothetical protein AVEN_171527-1 [Araneus ventricosus]